MQEIVATHLDQAYLALRENVAAEHQIRLYRRYNTAATAHFLGIDESTVKRWRKHWRKLGVRGPVVEDPGGGIWYFGYQVCDLLILGKDVVKWQNILAGISKSETGGSNSADSPTTPSATTPPSEAMSALALAQQSLRKPSKGSSRIT